MLSRMMRARPVVQVDHDRLGAAGFGDIGMIVVSDGRDHVVAVLVQVGQDVGADEPSCAG